MMLPSLCAGCSAWLFVPLLVFAQGSCPAVAILDSRARRSSGGGGGDSNSNSDSNSCGNGVCTVCKIGVCTTSTQVSIPPGPQTATATGSVTMTSALNTSSTGTNTALTTSSTSTSTALASSSTGTNTAPAASSTSIITALATFSTGTHTALTAASTSTYTALATSSTGTNTALTASSMGSKTALTTPSTATNTAPTSGANAGNAGSSNNTAAKKGLSTGGIAGLTVGLAIIAGLLIMLFLKQRAHLRHLAKRPRGGVILLSHDTPSSPASPDLSGAGSLMAESGFSSGVVSSAATTIAASDFAAILANGYYPPQPYKSFNADANGTSTSFASSAFPFAQPNPSHSERQSVRLVDIETQSSDGVLLSPLPLPSPHEQSFDLIDAAAASSSEAVNRQSQDLWNFPSTTDADMMAFREELERDDAETNQASGSRPAEDASLFYSD
ncbi:hypothetical protein FPV67DRAFT_995747 [Lyophyllum atratum]|nr:hypothetical protein FPV67DRAFT_995747 [Lyophyllum atratum]